MTIKPPRSTNQPHGKAVLVTTIVDEYLRSQKYLSLAVGTKMRYQSSLRLFERLILANNKNVLQMFAHKVDYGVVDYLHAVLSHSHAAGSIRFYFAVMSNVWEASMRTGRVATNPWAKAGVKVDNERDLTWNPEQVEAAIAVCKEMGFDTLALYILFGYETGIRMWSDLRRLTWDMIHKDEKGWVLDFIIAKTGVHLMLPLSNVIISALKSSPISEGYIFQDRENKLLSARGLDYQFQKVKAAAKLGDLQLRDLRRTAVTELVKSGATDREITAITGWLNPAGVINRYARVRFETAENGMHKRWANRENSAVHSLTEGS